MRKELPWLALINAGFMMILGNFFPALENKFLILIFTVLLSLIQLFIAFKIGFNLKLRSLDVTFISSRFSNQNHFG